MHVTLSMAISMNGMIAHERGDEDFLSKGHWAAFRALAASCGILIVTHAVDRA